MTSKSELDERLIHKQGIYGGSVFRYPFQSGGSMWLFNIDITDAFSNIQLFKKDFPHNNLLFQLILILLKYS
jgi:hypothetical protein